MTFQTLLTLPEVNLPPKPLNQLPETWHIPPKNRDFTGREEYLAQVTQQLQQSDQPVVLTAFHGLGGVDLHGN